MMASQAATRGGRGLCEWDQVLDAEGDRRPGACERPREAEGERVGQPFAQLDGEHRAAGVLVPGEGAVELPEATGRVEEHQLPENGRRRRVRHAALRRHGEWL